MRAATVALCSVLLVADARATCNVIPSTDRIFQSRLGAVDRPFARPGDVVVIQRDEPVFSHDAAQNRVTFAFKAAGIAESTGGEDEIALEPLPALLRVAASSCSDDLCNASGCFCIRVALPDTDHDFPPNGDRRTLTGPVEIRVRTGARETASIGRLTLADTGFTDNLFPHFVALPPANRFADFRDAAADVLAAEDTAGNLFIPLDFAGIVPADERRTRFLEAVVPFLGLGGPAHIDVFTIAGQRLPPLARQLAPGSDSIVGTADTRESVFRIEKGALRPKLNPLPRGGPVVVPNVIGHADDRKQADPVTLIAGQRFVVYEARECDLERVPACASPSPVPAGCIDINADGDVHDYLLYALDVTLPGATPVVVDEVDACDMFPGYPGVFPSFGLYGFAASDALVAFRIAEAGYDIDQNGRADDLLRTGAFDLLRAAPITPAAGSPRQELDGTLLAYSQPAGPGRDGLFWYDAAAGAPGPWPVGDASHAAYLVTRHAIGGLERGRQRHPFDVAVAQGRIAFVGPEAQQGADLTGDGDQNDGAVLVFDVAARAVRRIGHAITTSAADATLALTSRRLAFQTDRSGPLGSRLAVAVQDVTQPALPARFLCEGTADGLLAPSISDEIVACLHGGPLGTLHVLAGTIERNLGLRVTSRDDVRVSDSVLVVGVDEALQGTDLDGDGTVGTGVVLHTFDGRRQAAATNYRRRIVRSAPPFLQFIAHGLVVLSPATGGSVRTIFRDVDDDGVFEEPIPTAFGAGGAIEDNCPTLENDTQADGDGDGVGDACECPTLRVETVRAFAGSRVQVPVDFEPGQWEVASGNFMLESGGGATTTLGECIEGPIVRTARAALTCVEQRPGAVVTFVENPNRDDLPALGAGEIASYDFAVPATSPGTTLEMCIPHESVAYGDTQGYEIKCPAPRHCGEVRVDPFCKVQGDCNCDGIVNTGDRICLITKFFEPELRNTCDCEDCNLSGRLNAADAPCITRCTFGDCVTYRR